MESISLATARRLALSAQGFGVRITQRVDRRQMLGTASRLGLLQIDSVNVAVRAHYMPLFSRLGSYRRDRLDQLAYQERALFEYWGHEASLLPLASYPLFRWKMEAAQPWGGVTALTEEAPGYIEAVRREIAERGPLAASDLSDPGARTGPWWGYGKGKTALEWLAMRGELAVAGRRNFAIVYDLSERVIPTEVRAAPVPSRPEAERELLRRAAAALGVGTAADLADYFRLSLPGVRPLLSELAEAGELAEVRVEGWEQPAFMHPNAGLTPRPETATLVSPFDSLLFYRPRVERLFGFHYRIEIYVPAPKRRYGYYVYPFLLGDRLAARVDLKADRPASVLRVPGAFLENGAAPRAVANALAGALRRMADWLELERVVVGRRGDLAPLLRAALASAPARR